MIKIQLTQEFIEWLKEEWELITDEPEDVAQEFVGQLYFTGCLKPIEDQIRQLEAENARLVAGIAKIEQRWREASQDKCFRAQYRQTMELCADELAALLP